MRGEIPTRVLAKALALAAFLRRRKHVLGLSIGMRQRAGVWVPEEPCIAIRVTKKPAVSDLQRRQVFPRFILVRSNGESWRVPTDVRTGRGLLAGQCYGHVSKPLALASTQQAIGGISACVITTSEPRLLISGHVAVRAGRRMVADGLEITTERPYMTSRLDHCLARADFDLADATLPNGVPFAGIRDRTSVTRGEELFVYRARDGMYHRVVVRDVNADALFDYPAGQTRVYGLIVVDDVCAKGDSGCPLFDADFQLVGTLLGGVGEDYYLPADYAFQKLSIALPI